MRTKPVAIWSCRGCVIDLTITVDSIGNVVGVMDGEHDGQPVMTGSHIDTVRTGGRYDGNLGVLAGLEVIETLRSAGITPPRGLAVAFFTDEEGPASRPTCSAASSTSAA